MNALAFGFCPEIFGMTTQRLIVSPPNKFGGGQVGRWWNLVQTYSLGSLPPNSFGGDTIGH
jgi:hypothetical protein